MVIPRQLFIQGKPHNIGIAGVFIVDKEHRTLLPALSLIKAVKALVDNGEFDLIYGLPNKKATAVFMRAGFKKLGPFVKLCKPLSVARRLDTRKPAHCLAKPLAYLYDLTVRLVQPETWHKTPPGLRCEIVNSVDGRFDRLWLQASKDYSIIGDRRSSYLQWRYNDYTGSDVFIYGMLDQAQNEAIGYIAYRVKKGYISVRDALLPADPTAEQSLILNFLRLSRKLGAKSITVDVLKNARIIKSFTAQGFSLAVTDRSVHFVYNENLNNDIKVISDYANWILFRGDMDP